MRCIYCLEEKDRCLFNRRDHVIPQCFGVFKNNLTLINMVCNDCNKYFGEYIERCLGRDSFEGIARYRFGKNPKEKQIHRRLKFTVEKGVFKGVHVIPISPDQNRNDELQIVSQVGFYNSIKNEYDYFMKEEIPEKAELEKQGYKLKNKEIIFYGKIEDLVETLKNKGINVKITEVNETVMNPEPSRVPVLVKARIDRTLYRGLSKIVFNYLAYNKAIDFVLKDDFNKIRNFIRYNEGDSDDFFKITTKPILYKESRFGKRWYVGHFIVIDWNNFNLVGKLSIYNSIVRLTYNVILCKNFKGFWLPFNKGHYFDPISKTVREIYTFKFLVLP